MFSGVNSSIKELNEELSSLGGGDARLSPLELDCLIDDRIENTDAQTLWPLGKSIGLRNATLPRNQPVADTMKYFNVSSATRLSTTPKNQSPYYTQSR